MFRIDGGFKSPNVFSACAFGFFVYLAGEIAYFTAIQRFASVPTVRDAQRAVIVKGGLIAFACTLFFVLGTSLFGSIANRLPTCSPNSPMEERRTSCCRILSCTMPADSA